MKRAETCSWSLCNKLYIPLPPYSCVRQVYTLQSSEGKFSISVWYELTPTRYKSEVLPLEITCLVSWFLGMFVSNTIYAWHNMGYNVILQAVTAGVQTIVFWVIILCRIVRLLQPFGGTCCFHLQGNWTRFMCLIVIVVVRSVISQNCRLRGEAVFKINLAVFFWKQDRVVNTWSSVNTKVHRPRPS